MYSFLPVVVIVIGSAWMPNARTLPQMHGRERQLAQICAHLRAVANSRRGVVLLVEAAPGAGKTRLLGEAVGAAERNSFAVVGSRGGGAGGDAGSGPGRGAGSGPGGGAGADTGDGGAPDGSGSGAAPGAVRAPAGARAVIEAARARLARDAEPTRTLVVFDDLHRAGPSALTALSDLIVTFRTRPVVWLLAFTSDRPPARGPAWDPAGDPDGGAMRDTAPYDPVRACVGGLRDRILVEAVRELGPLSGDALTRLVTDCTGAVPDPALLALAECVGGTPRAVIELMRGLVEDGDVHVVDGLSRIVHGTAPGRIPAGGGVRLPAPVPKRFSAWVRRDLRSLSESTLRALRLAAVLGSPFAPEDLSTLLGQAPAGLLTAVDEAVVQGLLVCGEHDLAFRSEPIWRVLLDSVPPPVCVLLRRQAAEMLLSRPGGVERAALQLVHVAHHGNAEELRVIAEGARKLLATDPPTAARLAIRCMELLSPGQPERVRLARTAVEAYTRAGELDRAITLARETIDEATGLAAPVSAEDARTTRGTGTTGTVRGTENARSAGGTRAVGGARVVGTAETTGAAEDIAALQASMSTALLLLGNAPMARRAADDALAAQQGGRPRREAVITHLAASYLTGDSTAPERAQKIISAPDPHAQAVQVAMIFHAFGQWRDGKVGSAVETLREAVALDPGGDDARLLDPRWFLAFALTRTDEYEEAAAVVRRSTRSGGAAGSSAATGARTPAAAVAALLRAPLHLALGRLDDAEEAARTGVGADGGPHVPLLAPQAWLVLAHAALRRGALARAEDHLRTLDQGFPQHASSPWSAARDLLSAQLAEARTDARAAADVLAEIGERPGGLRELVLVDPAAAAWCVRCALAADLPGLVKTVVDTVDQLQAHNPCVPAVLASAAHARALAGKDAEGVDRAGLLHRNPWARASVAEDHAGLLLDRGEHERAIGELDRAMNAYGALGGEWDAARVRARLRELGVRRRHWTHTKRPVSGWESLTTTERKVAELVAGGLTNRQAARHLYISPHTVGFHLRQIYRKLGIQSRTALIRFTA